MVITALHVSITGYYGHYWTKATLPDEKMIAKQARHGTHPEISIEEFYMVHNFDLVFLVSPLRERYN